MKNWGSSSTIYGYLWPLFQVCRCNYLELLSGDESLKAQTDEYTKPQVV
jgi:hypothetical protein